jgi:uncharacterized membrane-anchored protein YitT (DUF2179 family)
LIVQELGDGYVIGFGRKAFAIIIGSLLIGIGINGFLAPLHLLDGGIIGISLIMTYLWGVKSGLTIILLSIPIFLIAWFHYRTYFFSSLHGMLCSSFFIDFSSSLKGEFHFHPFFSAVIGGIFIGSGIGIMLSQEVSTGGTDLLAQFISKIYKWNVGFIIFLIDAIVILIGSKTLGPETFIYSSIAVLVIGITTSSWTSKKAPGLT